MRHYKGNYSKYLDLKAEQLASEWKAYEKQQTEIHKLEDFVARNLVRASTTKRAQSRRKTLEKWTDWIVLKGMKNKQTFYSV